MKENLNRILKMYGKIWLKKKYFQKNFLFMTKSGEIIAKFMKNHNGIQRNFCKI